MPKVKRTRKGAMSIAAKHVSAATRERSLLVHPNRESTVKVERTAFSLPSVELSLRNPKKFRVEGYALPQGYKTTALRTNAPTPGFAYISSLVVANVLGTVGVPESARPPWRDKLEDERLEEAMRRGEPCIALDQNVFPGEELRDCRGCYQDAYGEFPFELPTLAPSTRVTLEGFYSGYVPNGYAVEAPFLFTMTFSGYATIVEKEQMIMAEGDGKAWGVWCVDKGAWCCIEVNQNYGSKARCEEVFRFVRRLSPSLSYEIRPYSEGVRT